MPIVTRRYVFQGPQNDELQEFAAAAAINASFPGPTVLDIDYDDAIDGIVGSLDEFMQWKGFVPGAAQAPGPLATALTDGATSTLTDAVGGTFLQALQITIVTDGNYAVFFDTTFVSAAASDGAVAIGKNGAALVGSDRAIVGLGGTTLPAKASDRPLALVAGDTIEGMYQMTAGTSVSVTNRRLIVIKVS